MFALPVTGSFIAVTLIVIVLAVALSSVPSLTLKVNIA